MISIGQKGQLSVEYLLLILVFLLIVGTVTIPLIGDSIDAANDVSNTAAARSIVDDIGNAVNIVYANGPGAKRTLNVFVPIDGMEISYQNKEIYIDVDLNNPLNGEDTYKVSRNVDYDVNVISPSPLTRDNYEVVIEWDRSSPNVITVTLE